MENSREAEAGGSTTHLPAELWTQILCFLPVKPLLLFRTVSKTFLSTIDHPEFAPLHLRSLPSNTHQTLTLAHTYLYGRFEIRDTTIGSPTLPAPLDPELEPVNCRILTASLDGLVLLTPPPGGPLVGILWNPSAGKTRRIQLPNPISDSNPTPDDSYSNPSAIGSRLAGLAYDSSCRDYKVLYITYEYLAYCDCQVRGLSVISARPLGVWVYGVKTRSWTAVNMGDSGICALRARSCGYPCSVFHEGAVVWIEGWYLDDDEEEYHLRMVRFEAGTNKFGYCFDLPVEVEKHRKMESRLVSLDGGSTLGLCGLDSNDSVVVWAWVASDGGWWVERCVVPECPVPEVRFGTFVHLSRNEELSWKYRASDGTRKICTYNLRTGHYSEMNPSRCMFYEAHQCAYIQSLIKV